MMTFLFGFAVGGVGILACLSFIKMLLDNRLGAEERIAYLCTTLFHSLVIWLLVVGYAAVVVQP